MRCLTCNTEIFGSLENHRSPNHVIDDVETCYAVFNGYQNGIYYYKGESQSPSVADTGKLKVDDAATGQPFRGFAPRKKNL